MSASPFDPDDPRLTAYALGEIDEADRRAVEAMLAESVEARAEVERTQAFARLLTAEYARENELYLASRPEPAASNVIPFPGVTRSRWRPGVAPWLGVAAVLALTASLVHLGLKRSHQPPQTVASAPPGAPTTLPAPASTAAGSLANDQQAADRVGGSRAGGKSTTGANTPQDIDSVATTPVQVPIDLDGALAMDRQRPPARSKEQTTIPQAAEPAPASAAAPSMASRATTTKSADATGRADKPVPAAVQDDPAARCTVRVRASDGTFFDGVIISTDGLILSYTPLPDDRMRRPCTVTLADQRDFTANPEPAPLGAGWYWLRIKADGLSAASLGADIPASGTPLTVALMDAKSGRLTFSHLQSGVSGTVGHDESFRPFKNDVAFAFDPAGELLVVGPTVQQPGSIGRAKAVDGRLSTGGRPARPFTLAEQRIIQQAAKQGESPTITPPGLNGP